MTVDPQLFRKVMGNFPTGVTVLTTVTATGVFGMTANAITSVSLEPTLVLVCIGLASKTHDYVKTSGVYALNILSAEQQRLAELFAMDEDAAERAFASVPYERAGSGSPIIPGVLAYLDCHVVAEYPGGDHTIFVGEVDEAAVLDDEAEPLLFFRGTYHRLKG